MKHFRCNIATFVICAAFFASISINISAQPNITHRTALQATTVEMTTAVPAAYFQSATQQGTVELFTYNSTHHINDSIGAVSKPAYVYLPYGYDPAKQYDIIYLLHGWHGTSHSFFYGATLRNMFDNLIENKITRPFIAVSPTWDVDDASKDWATSSKEVDIFYMEYENDLIPAIESHYSTYAMTTDYQGIVDSREHRAYGGFSLGGVSTWNVFEHCFDLQRWYLPMSGDSWHYKEFGGRDLPDSTAMYLASVAQASRFKSNFHVWYAVGTNDTYLLPTDNQAHAMMELTDTFNSSTFSYHQKQDGQHNMAAMLEYTFNALPFFFPYETTTATNLVATDATDNFVNTFSISGRLATSDEHGLVIQNGRKILR